MTGMAVSTFTQGPVIWLTGLPALAMPKDWAATRALDDVNIGIANNWIRINNWMIDHVLPNMDWRISLPDDLSVDKQYILSCNHQTWVDTAVMQYVGVDKMPLTRFFTKAELIYIPFVGQAFKILGFPMMKRHSADAIAKNPKLRGQDLVEAKKACAKMKTMPFTLLNYLEGTRFTAKKHAEQKSPYKNLLKPKYGGMALAFSALKGSVDEFLDMTIVYPDGAPEYLDLWRGQVSRIGVDVRKIELPDWVGAGDYHNDEAYKVKFKAWIDEIWQQKDALIDRMKADFT